jgi:hypothetical protein
LESGTEVVFPAQLGQSALNSIESQTFKPTNPMKSSSLTSVSALIMMSGGSITLVAGSITGLLPRAASILGSALMLVVVALAGYGKLLQVRKARVLVPVKTQRNESPRVIVRRGQSRW